MNVAQTAPDAIDPLALGEPLGVLEDELWLSAHVSAAEPRPVRMLCLLERDAGLPLRLRALPANPLAFAPYMLGLSGEPQRRASRFLLYANLSEQATLVRLSTDLEQPPGELADLIERALACEAELAFGGVR